MRKNSSLTGKDGFFSFAYSLYLQRGISSAYQFPSFDSYAFEKSGSLGRRKRRSVADQEDILTLGRKVKKLRRDVEDLKSPLGNKDNPARSCLDLFHCGKKFKDGR